MTHPGKAAIDAMTESEKIRAFLAAIEAAPDPATLPDIKAERAAKRATEREQEKRKQEALNVRVKEMNYVRSEAVEIWDEESRFHDINMLLRQLKGEVIPESQNIKSFRTLIEFAKKHCISLNLENSEVMAEAWGVDPKSIHEFGLPARCERPGISDHDLRELATAFGLDAEDILERSAIMEIDGGVDQGLANRRAIVQAVSRLVTDNPGIDDDPAFDDAFDLLERILGGYRGHFQPHGGISAAGEGKSTAQDSGAA